MKIFLRIIGIVLIAMSAVMLLASPLIGMIGLAVGMSIFVYSFSYKTPAQKQAEAEEKARIEAEEREAKRIERLHKILENPIFLDTETTGLNPDKNDEMLSLSIIAKDGSVLFDQMFRPERRKTWKQAQDINGISPAMVRKCEPFSSYADEVQEIVNASTGLIGYNVLFDLDFLYNAGIKMGQPEVDVMQLFTKKRTEKTATERRYTLKYAAKSLGYDWNDDEAHSSLYDAQATRFVYSKLLKEKEGIDL